MDKKSISGFVLISLVLVVWFIWMSSNQQKAQVEQQQKLQQQKNQTEQIKNDSLNKLQKQDTNAVKKTT